MTLGLPWVRSYDAGARLRLFCFPYAGGGTADYRTWRPSFPGSIDICPVHLPAREARMSEKPITDLSTMVGSLADALNPLMGRTPFAFTGHSMGAWIAYELACELRRRRRPMPVHLFLSARRPPDVPNPMPQLYHLPDGEFVQEIQRRFNAIPQQILDNPTFMKMFLPALRGDYALLETWHPEPEPPLDVPITAFAGTSDTIVTRAMVHEWRRHTTAEFQLRQMPGGHFFLRDSADLLTDAIAGSLRRYL